MATQNLSTEFELDREALELAQEWELMQSLGVVDLHGVREGRQEPYRMSDDWGYESD